MITKSNIKISATCKFAIWLVAKLPVSSLRDRVIKYLLNHLIKIRTNQGWQWVMGVKFGDHKCAA